MGLLQMASGPQPQDNLEKAREGIRRAADRGVQILCLQELFRSQYFCQTEDENCFDLAEPVPGPTTEALSALARRHRMAMVVPLFERRAAGPLPQYGRRSGCGWRLAGKLSQDAHPR